MKHETHNAKQKTCNVKCEAPSSKLRGGGFSLIEMLIYVALAGIITAVLTSFVTANIKAYDKAQARQNVFYNVNGALRLIIDEIKYAKSIYTPTATLASDAGQLSLETLLNPPTGENIAYVDFYVDNGRIYEKREGQAASALTSERVFIERLRFTMRSAAAGKDSIDVEIEGRINTQNTGPKDQARMTMSSTAALRGEY